MNFICNVKSTVAEYVGAMRVNKRTNGTFSRIEEPFCERKGCCELSKARDGHRESEKKS